MTRTGTPGGSPFVLLPHQAKFIDEFFAVQTTRWNLLQSDVGLGTTIMTAHLLLRAIAASPESRLLLLTPKALQSQYCHTLAELAAPVQMVDRYRQGLRIKTPIISIG